jgi:hypothetical protein
VLQGRARGIDLANRQHVPHPLPVGKDARVRGFIFNHPTLASILFDSFEKCASQISTGPQSIYRHDAASDNVHQQPLRTRTG